MSQIHKMQVLNLKKMINKALRAEKFFSPLPDSFSFTLNSKKQTRSSSVQNTPVCLEVKDRREKQRSKSDELPIDSQTTIYIKKADNTFLGHWSCRISDIIISLCFLLTFGIIILPIIALLIKLNSKGPIIYSSDRVGIGGKIFKCYKFRTMVQNAESLKHLVKNERPDDIALKNKNDLRITGKLGHFLRNNNLDELPQLFNVLRGDMTIVGPRPPIPQEVKKYKSWHLERLSVLPGLTCIWQSEGSKRHDIAFDDWVRLDLRFIKQRSVKTYYKIILKTISTLSKDVLNK